MNTLSREALRLSRLLYFNLNGSPENHTFERILGKSGKVLRSWLNLSWGEALSDDKLHTLLAELMEPRKYTLHDSSSRTFTACIVSSYELGEEVLTVTIESCYLDISHEFDWLYDPKIAAIREERRKSTPNFAYNKSFAK